MDITWNHQYELDRILSCHMYNFFFIRFYMGIEFRYYNFKYDGLSKMGIVMPFIRIGGGKDYEWMND